jgi:hypothetical protein
MKEETKTHYRKVHKSEHLGVADLEEMIEEKKSLILTITHVEQLEETKVAGKMIKANIAYFKEKIKPWVLNNAKNGKIMAKFTGSKFVEDWNNVLIELFIDPNVKMSGEVVGGVRIRSIQPIVRKPLLNDQSEKWETAKQRVKEGMTIQGVRKHYQVSQADYDKLCL